MKLNNSQITVEQLNQLMDLLQKIDPNDKIFKKTKKYVVKRNYSIEKEKLLALKKADLENSNLKV